MKERCAAAACAATLLAAAFCLRRALISLERGAPPVPWLVATGMGAAVSIFLSATLATGLPDPTGHAQRSTAVVLMGYLALHAFVALIFAAYGIWRYQAGYLSPLRSLDLRLGRAWTDYTAVTGLAALGALLLLSLVIGAP